MPLNVAIGFVTGRKHFQNVLRSYVNNWLEHGLIEDKNIRLNIFVSYDLKYFKTQIQDYKNVPPEVAEMVDSLHFFGTSEVKKEVNHLIDTGILSAVEAELLFGEGYAKKRNVVTYVAIKNRMDKLIFIDDDEYPAATFKNEFGRLLWMGQSVIGTHLRYNAEADITHGYHCGYISPIPFIKFNETLTEDDFRQFIEAVSNDIISWEGVRTNMVENAGVTYADEYIINHPKTWEVPEENGMKFISGANLCFNLENAASLPPFYNPPGARGEDTFMSTCLTDLKVLKVPCYTFHDGFLMYNNILNGVLPVALQPIENNSPAILKRFVNATIGWMRYKPLLVYITNREHYEEIMDSIEQRLLYVIPKLNSFFKTDGFTAVLHEFKKFRKRVPAHYEEFQHTKNAWKKLMGETVNSGG